MRKSLIIQLHKLLCIAIIFTMTLPYVGVGAESEKSGTFWGYLYSDSVQSHNLIKPFDLTYTNINAGGVFQAAKETATYLKSMPEGKRGIDIHLVMKHITDYRENIIWWDKGTAVLAELFDSYFAALKKEGAELNYVIDDLEADMSNWTVNTKAKTEQIENDPRYKSEIRPLLEERGFTFGGEGKWDLYYVVNYTRNPTAYHIWNNVMDSRIADYYNRAVYEPLKKYFPDAKLGNYGLSASKGEVPIMTGAGHKTYLGGPTKNAGTHSSPVLYGIMVHITYPGRAPDGYPFNQFKPTGFNCALMELIKTQDKVMSTDGGKIMPWIGLKTWQNNTYKNFFNTKYYNEFVLHLGLLNPDPFLIYNIGAKDQGGDEKLLSELFGQLDEVAGYSDRKPLLQKASSWDTRYLLTGMYAGGKNIWRITPDLYTPGISMENFLTDREKLIFQIGNQVVVFPEGSVLYEPKKRLSEYGYWVITPKDKYPQELRVDGIEPPEEPVATEDYIPTGHTFKREYTKYVPGQKYDNPSKPAARETAGKTEKTPSHWAQKALDAAVREGLLLGTGNGLMPDNDVTRAEFITILLRTLKMEVPQGENWFDGPMGIAKNLKWISEEDSAQEALSREETAAITMRAFEFGATSRRASFTDKDTISKDMMDSVLDAASLGIITGYPDGTFKPKGRVTRAEAVTIILRCAGIRY